MGAIIRACIASSVLLCCCELAAAQAITIRTTELPWAIKGLPYDAEVATAVNGRCGINNIALTVAAGQLPKGLELFSFGFRGTPQQMGHFHFTLRAANTCAETIRSFDLLVTGKPILLAFPSQITFRYRAGGTAQLEDVVRVEGSWPDLPYSIDISNAPWLKAEPSEGKTPDAESALTGDRVHLKVAPANLAPGTYTATIKFYANAGENAPKVDIVLNVLKAE